MYTKQVQSCITELNRYVSGFDDADLEKPMFDSVPAGHKVALRLSPEGSVPLIQVKSGLSRIDLVEPF